MEKFLYKDTTVYIDVCHNDQGLLASLELLGQTEQRVTLLCAFSKSKDISSMLHILLTAKKPILSAVYPVSAEHIRLVKVSDLSKQMNAIDHQLF